MTKTLLVLAALFCTALPVAAQSRLYTNADLGTVQRTRTMTAAELEGLKAREFVYVPARREPTVIILPDTPRFPPFAATSEPTRPLSEPWSMTTYLGHGGHGRRSGRFIGPVVVGPGIHLVYGR